MNIKAIIASLVLGSSSVAMADPGVTFSAEGQLGGSAVVRDHRDHYAEHDGQYGDDEYGEGQYDEGPYDDRDDRSRYDERRDRRWHRGGWAGRDVVSPAYRRVTLASGLLFGGDGREFITVGRDSGRFRSLQINAAGGRTFIKQVYVQFANGEEQVMRDLDATLTGNQTLRLDLNGGRRAIRRIVVYGTDINGGWRRSGGAFSVTAV